VRSYDSNTEQWTTPDAYKGDVHDPMSQRSYMWNDNNPVAYSDPSGYDPDDLSQHAPGLLWDFGMPVLVDLSGNQHPGKTPTYDTKSADNGKIWGAAIGGLAVGAAGSALGGKLCGSVCGTLAGTAASAAGAAAGAKVGETQCAYNFSCAKPPSGFAQAVKKVDALDDLRSILTRTAPKSGPSSPGSAGGSSPLSGSSGNQQGAASGGTQNSPSNSQ
jgi:hypothetical protein